MSEAVKKIVDEVRMQSEKLSKEERLELMRNLREIEDPDLESETEIDESNLTEIERAWLDEADRAGEEYESGRDKGYSWEEVKQSLEEEKKKWEEEKKTLIRKGARG